MKHEVTTLASKMGFTEGPVRTIDGRLLVTSISRGKLYDIPLDGSEPYEVIETLGGPNGAAVDRHGDVWVAQNGGHVITMLPEPVVPPGVQRAHGDDIEYVCRDSLQAPNDLAFAPDGNLWFTDPYPRLLRDTPHVGRVWRFDVTTGATSLVNDSLFHPNGLAFSADGNRLFIAETVPRRIWQFSLDGDHLVDGTIFHEFERGEPDGMAFDSEGNLYVACHEGEDAVVVIDPQGREAERIALDGYFPTNVCFAGDKLTTLVVTAPKGGRVLTIERDAPGLAI